jgi:diamine N-acetyltransferase
MKDSNQKVSLREITRETLRDITRLRVSPDQERLVATNAESIAEAYFSRDIAWFRAIYFDDTPVGFVMLEDNAAEERYYLWRFMIDARYQRRGIGQRALELLFEYVRTRPGAKVLYTSCVPGEGSPGPFYEKMGFTYTGEEDEGELVMRRELAATATEQVIGVDRE